ncbi:MAG TPA: AAA family ATPase [Cellvibrio sp.]|nr:AAA family ATPase [Cellvibrio sp.]
MYHTFFNLNEPAFSIAVNPRYLYMSQQHKEALAHLLYGVAGGGFVMLTGEVGTGKTTIIRCLLEQMPENTDIAIVMNPMSNVPELLSIICDELGIAYEKDPVSVKNLTDVLHHYLLKNHTKGRNTVLLIDEAQLLSAEALEQVRLLTNLETTTQKLLHIILVGQPELKNLLSKPQLRQLAQRITARFHLEPLTLPETEAYIRHRLKVAGLPEGRHHFPFPIIKRIHSFTGGIPRLINVISERCLIGAYASNKLQVDKQIFNVARKEVIGGLAQSRAKHYRLAAAIVSVALVIALGFFLASHYSLQKLPSGKTLASAQFSSSSTASAASSSASSQNSDALLTHIKSPDYKSAESRLFTYLGFPLAANTRPCGKNNKSGVQCEKLSVQTWTEIGEINRPVILTLATPDKFSVYVTLIGLSQENALLLDDKNHKVSVPLSKLGGAWTGDILYLWKKPQDFSEPLTLGDTSPTIEWLAQQFAHLDKQNDPLTNDLYNIAFNERIKLFQRTKGLPIDGIINQQTLLKVNEALAIDKTLLTDF